MRGRGISSSSDFIAFGDVLGKILIVQGWKCKLENANGYACLGSGL